MFKKIKQKLVNWYMKRKMRQTMNELQEMEVGENMREDLENGINEVEKREK